MPKKSKPASLLGTGLVDDGIITPEQLQRALKVQGLLERPKQLGEILIELGFATREAIHDGIARHGRGMRLGEILLESGLISAESLETALNIRKQSDDKPIGQILIEMGAVNERSLLQCLAHQGGVSYIEPTYAMIDKTALGGVSPDYLARNLFVPFCKTDNGKTLVIVPDLRNEETIAALEEIYNGNYQLALGPEERIRTTIEEIRHLRRDAKGSAEKQGDDEDGVAQLVEHIFNQAIDERASDVHIEPMAERIRVRYRIDGVLVYRTDLPKDLLPRLISRIKILAECNIAEQRKHQGGRIKFRKDGEEFDLRLSCYVSVHGECAVIRVLNKQMGLVGLDELGLAPSVLQKYREHVLELPTGVVIITGPTGSGKTTTLYSSLDYCNDMSRKIITVEDPVEYQIDGLIQCSIDTKAGRTFENSLREIVRQDPDIIVLGEIRDKLTAETAIQAALTGHKGYATFHTEDSIGGLVRLLNMEIEAFLISSTVVSIVAQRLLRRLCPKCKQPYSPTSTDVRRIGVKMSEIKTYEFFKGQGCSHCNYTGYRGRVGAYEMLVIDDNVKEGVLNQQPAHIIRQMCVESSGLVSMREDAIIKVIKGLTSFEEVARHTPQTGTVRPIAEIMSQIG